jgi:hypothetical protein
VPDSEKSSRSGRRNLATPEAFPIPPPQLPTDLGTIQHQLGGLTEAVATLKEQSREQSAKLDAILLDVHTAKGALKVLRWLLGIVGAIVTILLAAFLNHLFNGSAK